MKTGKKILTVMMMAVFMLAANAALVHAASLADTIKEGLKSGKSLQQVMDEAVKDGKPIGDVVSAAIKAGVKADDAVYTAIKAKPGSDDAKAIVKAALLTGAKFGIVGGAAKAAGATNDAVRVGYVNALIANGDTFSVASGKADELSYRNIFAYSPPADNTSKSTDKTSTTNTTSTFTYKVTNTGGSTPSTKTASPI